MEFYSKLSGLGSLGLCAESTQIPCGFGSSTMMHLWSGYDAFVLTHLRSRARSHAKKKQEVGVKAVVWDCEWSVFPWTSPTNIKYRLSSSQFLIVCECEPIGSSWRKTLKRCRAAKYLKLVKSVLEIHVPWSLRCNLRINEISCCWDLGSLLYRS